MTEADSEILDHFVRTRKKTMELFEQVPDNWLNKTAAGEEMTLGWLFMHIADGPSWWMNHCMGDGRGWQYPGDGPFGKQTIRGALTASLKRVVSFFKADDGTNMNRAFELSPEKREGEGCWTGRNRILYLVGHEVHHRGRIALALRQWGMTELPFFPF